MLSGYELPGGSKYYICSRARRGHDCPGRHVPCWSIEQAVHQALLDDIFTLENLLRVQLALQTVYLRSASTLEQECSQRTRRLRTVQGRISNLTVAIAEAGHSPARYWIRWPRPSVSRIA